MKRGATKEEIIRTTQELITRNGIRAVRVDEIVQTLGISKRTLYELFADKTELVNACLDDMNRQLHEKITENCKAGNENPLQRVLQLAQEYIDSLYKVEQSFLAEIRGKIAYADQRDEHRSFWRDELVRQLSGCREMLLLLPEIDIKTFALQILDTLTELRNGQTTCDELYLFSRTLLRGATTCKGLELLDNRT